MHIKQQINVFISKSTSQLITDVITAGVNGTILFRIQIGEYIKIPKETAPPARKDVTYMKNVEASNAVEILVVGGKWVNVLLNESDLTKIIRR